MASNTVLWDRHEGVQASNLSRYGSSLVQHFIVVWHQAHTKVGIFEIEKCDPDTRTDVKRTAGVEVGAIAFRGIIVYGSCRPYGSAIIDPIQIQYDIHR